MSDPTTQMRALRLHSYEEGARSLRVEAVPLPRLQAGQVLVRMLASPINPSDLAFINGRYGFRKRLPVVPGFEGSGVVIETTANMMARRLLGKRVACVAPREGDGTWAEYMAAHAMQCLPLPEGISDEQGAMMFVNPLTAWALIEIARKRKARAFVQTAAASALGRMIIRLANRFGLEPINVVRRTEQVELLRSLGAARVLNSSEPDFDEMLRAACAELDARLAFDAVGGELTGRVLHAMPKGARLTLYGALSMQECRIDPGDLIFGGKAVDGFILTDWIGAKSPFAMVTLQGKLKRMANDELRSEVSGRYALEEAARALADYISGMSRGKVIFQPQMTR